MLAAPMETEDYPALGPNASAAPVRWSPVTRARTGCPGRLIPSPFVAVATDDEDDRVLVVAAEGETVAQQVIAVQGSRWLSAKSAAARAQVYGKVVGNV